MKGYERVRDALDANGEHCQHLDAAQLVKHAFALRTQVQPDGRYAGLKPILFYIYAEPESWPGGRGRIAEAMKARRREEIAAFAREVEDDEAAFIPCSWRTPPADAPSRERRGQLRRKKNSPRLSQSVCICGMRISVLDFPFIKNRRCENRFQPPHEDAARPFETGNFTTG